MRISRFTDDGAFRRTHDCTVHRSGLFRPHAAKVSGRSRVQVIAAHLIAHGLQQSREVEVGARHLRPRDLEARRLRKKAGEAFL